MQRIRSDWALWIGIPTLLISTAVTAADISFVVVDGQGKPIVDAVVALTAQPSMAAEVNSDRPEKSLDQINKQFHPSVMAFRTGTLLYFINSDNIRHQVYSFSEAKKFETKLYAGRTAPPVLFDKPGVVVLGCNIHDSMKAYLYVLDTPYFAKTDGGGSATITAPTARYSVQIWHPLYKSGQTPFSQEIAITKLQESFYETLLLEPPPAAPLAGKRAKDDP